MVFVYSLIKLWCCQLNIFVGDQYTAILAGRPLSWQVVISDICQSCAFWIFWSND